MWCGRWDLNPYVIQHTPLKRACLPIPALPHMQFAASRMQRIYYIQKQTLCQDLYEKIFFGGRGERNARRVPSYRQTQMTDDARAFDKKTLHATRK